MERATAGRPTSGETTVQQQIPDFSGEKFSLFLKSVQSETSSQTHHQRISETVNEPNILLSSSDFFSSFAFFPQTCVILSSGASAAPSWRC